MEIEDKLESVRNDIKQGLKSRAMNRLQGLINYYTNELIFREELAKLYESVDWKEKSGLYYFLTDVDTEESNTNIEIYLNSIKNSGYTALCDLKYKGETNSLSPKALLRYEELKEKSLKEVSFIPDFTDKSSKTYTTKFHYSLKEEIIEKIIFTLFISIPILAIIGLIQVIKWFY